jgi:hypothetical protein
MRHSWLGSLVAAAMVVACDREGTPTLAAPPVESAVSGVTAPSSKLTPLQQTGRALALALKDPSLRALIHQELTHSEVKEGKLHFQRFLRGAGAPLVAAMGRAAKLREEEVSGLLKQLGSAEFYLPVAEHRQRWSGGSELIVATQWEESEIPVGFDLEGQPVALSLEKPPDVPTLVIVPAESFDAEGLAYGRHLAQSGTSPSLTAMTGLWINEIHTNSGLYEPWTKGDPEFEIYLEKADSDPRVSLSCADQDLAVEPFKWDMNGNDYSAPFLVAEQNMLPTGTPRVLSMWEDDDGRCTIKTDRDYVKLTTDAFTNAFDVYKLINNKQYTDGQIYVKVYNAYISLRSIISGGDDYVGTAAVMEDITTAPKQFTLMNQNMNPTGWGFIQWKTDTAH